MKIEDFPFLIEDHKRSYDFYGLKLRIYNLIASHFKKKFNSPDELLEFLRGKTKEDFWIKGFGPKSRTI